MRVLVGEAGLEKMRDAKEGMMGLVVEQEDHEEGARMGRGCKVTSITSSPGSEVIIS